MNESNVAIVPAIGGYGVDDIYLGLRGVFTSHWQPEPEAPGPRPGAGPGPAGPNFKFKLKARATLQLLVGHVAI
jgi:hypothetical protein